MPSIFLCHASEDKPFVEPIQLALASAGCEVFYDEQSLPPGGDYQARIRAAINSCELFVFIASSASIVAGKFTLTELKFARERWPSPINRVLPVTVDRLQPRDLPNYLQAATILTVSGNAAAEVRFAVESMLRDLRRKRWRRWAAALAIAIVALTVAVYLYRVQHSDETQPLPNGIQFAVKGPQINSGHERETTMNEALELLNTGKIDQAIPAFQSVVKNDPRNSQAYSSLGYALEAAGRFDEAIVADRRAIELDETNVGAHWNLGNALYNKGDYKGAENSQRKALKISPSYTNAYYGLGNALMKLGRVEEAQREYEKARDPSKRNVALAQPPTAGWKPPPGPNVRFPAIRSGNSGWCRLGNWEVGKGWHDVYLKLDMTEPPPKSAITYSREAVYVFKKFAPDAQPFAILPQGTKVSYDKIEQIPGGEMWVYVTVL